MSELELPELVRRDASGISFYTDENLFDATGIRVAFTTRNGGKSKGEYAGLNLGLHVEDEEEVVLANRKIVLEAIHAPSSVITVCPNQVHGNHVCVVSSLEKAALDAAIAEAHDGADALVVTCQDVCAMLCYADCVPVILATPTGAFSVIHAGWRGVASRIVENAANCICEIASCKPSSVNAYIGPYIHKECFEVGADTYKIFADEFAQYRESVCVGDDHIDLGAAIKATMIGAGIASERIADLDKCTSCTTDEFFSYRASGGKCGRHAALAFRG